MAIYKVIVCSHCKHEQRYENKQKPKFCICENPFWDKPEYEYKLFMLQRDYIDSGYDIEYLKKMYPILLLYAKKLLLKKIKGKIFLTEKKVQEKVFDTVHKLYEYYLRDENYRVVESYAGALNYGFLDTLYNRKERAKNNTYSLNLELDDKGTELLTNIIGFGYIDLLDERDEVDEQYFKSSNELVLRLTDFLNNLISKAEENFNHIIAFKIVCGVNHLLAKRDDRFMDKYFDTVGRKVKNLIQWFYTKIYDFLKEYKQITNFTSYIDIKSKEVDMFRI